jgi:predicted lipid-binding transport protein (Tim44 family)
MILAGTVLALATFVAADFAEARRLGGGRTLGAQRQSIAPQAPTTPAARSAGATSQPVMPASPGAAARVKPAAAAAPAAAGASRWLDLSRDSPRVWQLCTAFASQAVRQIRSLLLIALLAGGAVFLLRMLLTRRAAPQAPLQYAGAGPTGARDDARRTSPSWGGSRVEPVLGPAKLEPASGKRLPPGFDADAFVRNAKQQFIALQAAHDAGDRKALADVMTPKMYAEIATDLDGQGGQGPTEVVTLDADVLEVVTEGREHWASVRYTGMLREDGASQPTAIDEIWNLTKPVDGSSGWLLAGIQQHA